MRSNAPPLGAAPLMTPLQKNSCVAKMAIFWLLAKHQTEKLCPPKIDTKCHYLAKLSKLRKFLAQNTGRKIWTFFFWTLGSPCAPPSEVIPPWQVGWGGLDPLAVKEGECFHVAKTLSPDTARRMLVQSQNRSRQYQIFFLGSSAQHLPQGCQP